MRSKDVNLTTERKLSPNSLTGYCCGLRFFYNETLGWDDTKLMGHTSILSTQRYLRLRPQNVDSA